MKSKKPWLLRAVFVSLRRGMWKAKTSTRRWGGRRRGDTSLFVYKATKEALIISAREMTQKEKKSYAKK